MIEFRKSLARAALAAMLAILAALPARAAYPERAITLIVPFAPGGPTDIIARILATALRASLGQPVIIDNRAGAAGNTGMGVAARAMPDGYTLLLTSTSIAVNPALFKNLPYDPFKDFIPISELVNAPNVLVVRPDSGIKSLADLVAQAKAAPSKFNYSSPGAGTKSHLTGELLKLRAGIQITTTSTPSSVIAAEMRVVMCIACTNAASANAARSRPAGLPAPSLAATAWVAVIDPVAAPLA